MQSGSASEIAAWKKRVRGFFPPGIQADEFDKLVKAWKSLDLNGYEKVFENFDWVKKAARLKDQGASVVTEGGELVFKDASGKTFGKLIKGEGDEAGDVFEEFSDADILPLNFGDDAIDWVDDSPAGLITRRADDGGTVDLQGRMVKLSGGTFGFVESLEHINAEPIIKQFIKKRGDLRRNFGSVITSLQEAHHLLPIALLKNADPDIKSLFQKAISAQPGFKYNDIATNGMALSKYRKATMMGLHASHPGYTRKVADELRRRINAPISEGGFGGINNISNGEAKELLESITMQLRTRIQIEVDLGAAGTRINMIENLF